jgi:hypothetical protein
MSDGEVFVSDGRILLQLEDPENHGAAQTTLGVSPWKWRVSGDRREKLL